MCVSACSRQTTSACPEPRPAAPVRLAVLALVALAVSGCAVRKGAELPELGDWERRAALLAAIDDFEFSGRIGVRAGDDGFNGRLRWLQDADDFSATVGGPLGIGTVRIEGNGDSVALTDKDGVTTVLADVEPDLYYRYGWTIPVESLRYWALGIPDPAEPATTVLDDEDLLKRLEQSDWTVEISRYDEGGGQQMPRILTARNGDTRVRMVIDRWLFFDN